MDIAGGVFLVAGGSSGLGAATARLLAGCGGQVGQAAYAASKGGVVAMTLPMAIPMAAK